MWQRLILGQRAPGHTAEQLHHLFLGAVPFATDTKKAFESHMPSSFFVIEGHYVRPSLGCSRSSTKSSLTPSESNHSSQTGSVGRDRKSTRLNSSHVRTSDAVFCLKKKTLDHSF